MNYMFFFWGGGSFLDGLLVTLFLKKRLFIRWIFSNSET